MFFLKRAEQLSYLVAATRSGLSGTKNKCQINCQHVIGVRGLRVFSGAVMYRVSSGNGPWISKYKACPISTIWLELFLITERAPPIWKNPNPHKRRVPFHFLCVFPCCSPSFGECSLHIYIYIYPCVTPCAIRYIYIYICMYTHIYTSFRLIYICFSI